MCVNLNLGNRDEGKQRKGNNHARMAFFISCFVCAGCVVQRYGYPIHTLCTLTCFISGRKKMGEVRYCSYLMHSCVFCALPHRRVSGPHPPSATASVLN
jgi:hypothetical protein